MTLPYVSTDLQTGQERQHRTQIAIATNELIKVRPPHDRTAAEVTAGVTPVNYSYPPGDVRRYGCLTDGTGDNSAAIANAILAAVASGGVGYIYHPGGTIAHASQITIPNNLCIIGLNRAVSEFLFTGTPSGSPASTRSGWRYTSGAVNSSGFASVTISRVKFRYLNTVDFAAALEISAGGWSYFNIHDVWITGGCSYGVICDATEILTLKDSLIENVNTTVGANIWLTNGADRSASQGLGFTNRNTIRDNQIAGGAGMTGLILDGGVENVVSDNNFNGHRFPMLIAGQFGGGIHGNTFETTRVTGSANLFVSNLSSAGLNVGPCYGIGIRDNGFYGNTSGGSLLTFGGADFTITGITKAASVVVTVSTVSTANPFAADQQLSFSSVVGMIEINGLTGFVTAIGGVSGAWTATVEINSSGFTAYASGGIIRMMHTGITVENNTFGSQLGRTGAIDVLYLANSWCGPNTDLGNTSMQHYNGVHNDVNGNTLLPPQNGSRVTLNINGPSHCDTRYQEIFYGGVGIGNGTYKITNLLLGSKTFDWPNIAASGNTNTTVTVTGAALGDKVLDVSMDLNIGTTAILNGHVESADTVRVILQNIDAVSALNLASATLSVLVVKAS